MYESNSVCLHALCIVDYYIGYVVYEVILSNSKLSLLSNNDLLTGYPHTQHTILKPNIIWLENY